VYECAGVNVCEYLNGCVHVCVGKCVRVHVCLCDRVVVNVFVSALGRQCVCECMFVSVWAVCAYVCVNLCICTLSCVCVSMPCAVGSL
jgi:hypothetical protein